MAIEMVKIRATVSFGSAITAGTPPLNTGHHILSFNVDRSRGQPASFSASLKVQKDAVSGGGILGSDVVIKAGEDAPSNTIFTGKVRTANITPCRDDPRFVIININGTDQLADLSGKKFTRRCRATQGVWVSITGVAREGLRSGKLTYQPRGPTLETIGGRLNREDNLTSSRPYTLNENVENAPTKEEPSEVTIDVLQISLTPDTF